jgi:hypothetical protein
MISEVKQKYIEPDITYFSMVGNYYKLYCEVCKSYTNHSLSKTFRRYLYHPDDLPNTDAVFKGYYSYETNEGFDEVYKNDSDEVIDYHVMSCNGCYSVVLLQAHSFKLNNETEDTEKTNHPQIIQWQIGEWIPTYEPREAKSYLRLNKKLTNIYKEVISTFNNRNYISCTIGLRSLLEGVCSDKGISGKELNNLEKKLDALSHQNILPANIVTHLHKYRISGNVAAHELEALAPKKLGLCIDIVEDLLNFIYDLEYKLQNIG